MANQEPTNQDAGIAIGLTNYGDRDFSLYLRRSFARSMGYSLDMLRRPVVGIAYTGSGFNNCHRHFPEMLEAVKRGVLAAGALPLEFPTVSLGEVFLNPTSLKFRNLMAMDTEEMIRAQPMDAVVLMGGCDKTVPAQLMGAVSANRPGDPARRRPDDDRAASRREARRLHRLPPLLGEVPGRRHRRDRDRSRRGPARHDGRHLRGHGHGLDHGLPRRGPRHDAAGHGGDPGGACRPAARRRGDRRRRRAPDRLDADARAHRHARLRRERLARSPGARRLDQRHPAPDGHRRPRRHRRVAAPAQRALATRRPCS